MIMRNSGTIDIQKGQATFVSAFTNSDSLLAATDTQIMFSGNAYLNGPLISEGNVRFDGYEQVIENVIDISGKTTFSRGTIKFSANSSIINLGNIVPEIMWEGTVEFNTGSEVALDSIKINGGSLGGTDDIQINKSFVWDGIVAKTSNLGTYQSGAIVTIASNAQLILTSGGNNKVYCQIDNYGTTICEGTQLTFYDDVDFNNYGTFLDSAYLNLKTNAIGSIFNNPGTYIKSGALVTNFDLNFENKPTGLLKGHNQIWMNGVFSNEGTVSPGDPVGALTISGDYPAQTSSSLQIEIGGNTAASEYDQLKISGSASLAGTLEIIMVNDFLPKVDDEFQIMTFASGSGSF